MKKVRGILFILVIVAVAFAAANTVSNLLKRPAPKEVLLVVAATDIASGDRLSFEKLKRAKWPQSSVPRGAFQDVQQVVGRVAAGNIHQGEPISEKRLVSKKEIKGGLGYGVLVPGMRAVSMRFDPVSGVSGRLKAGDRVDIIAANNLPAEKESKIARVILSGIKVLDVAYGQKSQRKEGIVTLLLSPEDCGKLAASEGVALRLAIRNPSDPLLRDDEATIFSISLGPYKASQLQALAQKKDGELNKRIEKGKRAVTVSFKDDDGICGFIKAQNRVDVLAVSAEGNIAVESKTPGSAATFLETTKIARIILQNIEVLAVEQEVTSPADIVAVGDKKKMVSSSKKARYFGDKKESRLDEPKNLQGSNRLNVIGRITLLLTPKETEKLMVAYNSEQIKFICRNKADKKIAATQGQKLVEVFQGDRSDYLVEIYQGSEEFGLSFDRDLSGPAASSEEPVLPRDLDPVELEQL